MKSQQQREKDGGRQRGSAGGTASSKILDPMARDARGTEGG